MNATAENETNRSAGKPDRFQIGVALALPRDYDLKDVLRVEIDSSADRWTGKRSTRILEGTESIRRAARAWPAFFSQQGLTTSPFGFTLH